MQKTIIVRAKTYFLGLFYIELVELILSFIFYTPTK
jgi:hypothetical protein